MARAFLSISRSPWLRRDKYSNMVVIGKCMIHIEPVEQYFLLPKRDKFSQQTLVTKAQLLLISTEGSVLNLEKCSTVPTVQIIHSECACMIQVLATS